MRELGVEGLTEDKRFLIVRDLSTDEQFRVPLSDETLDLTAGGSAGSAVPSTSTGAEKKMDTILTPREIQARIRRGESPDEVASATGMAIEQIEPFAGPVLDEREYMAQQAQRTTVRRKHVSGGGVHLGQLVADGIRAEGGSADDAAWDSARRDDGRWTITVTTPTSESPATFLYDVASRYVMPTDETAHSLVGDVALPDTADMALADAVRDSAALPSAPEPEFDEEIVEEAVEIDDLSEPSDVPTRRDEDAQPDDELELDLGLPADVAAAEALLDGQELPPVFSLKEARDRRAQSAMSQQADDDQDELPHDPGDDHLESSIEHDVAVPDTERPGKKRHERRRVPSWDEIMFGDRND